MQNKVIRNKNSTKQQRNKMEDNKTQNMASKLKYTLQSKKKQKTSTIAKPKSQGQK